jgi:chemotaxis family two-component system response regulator Rcp1
MKKEVQILLVEDNEGDIVLTLEALKEAKVFNNVQVVKDGEAALQYIRNEDIYKNVETPDLILLDINLPKVNGMEVLTEIKNDVNLMTIPVVMLTTSNSEKDILEAYQHHANCFITKPVDYQKLMDTVHTIKNFWIDIVKITNKKKFGPAN